MTEPRKPPRNIAIVGAGMAGAACAQRLIQAGCTVTVFEKSRGAGGRMATRRVRWSTAEGVEAVAHFDHGAPAFTAQHPAFMAAVAVARSEDGAAFWAPAQQWLSQPEQPSWTKQLLRGARLLPQHTVQRLEAQADGWRVACAEHPGVGAEVFDAVLLAIPAVQAAPLLQPHHSTWARQALEIQQIPLWTLMAAADGTDEINPSDTEAADTPSIIQPADGPLALVIANHRKPGRPPSAPRWVAHAREDWTRTHLENAAEAVQATLLAALESVLRSVGAAAQTRAGWSYATVHRWRYAHVGSSVWVDRPCLWDATLHLGVAGDAFAGPALRETGVERAWRSGTALAEQLLSSNG